MIAHFWLICLQGLSPFFNKFLILSRMKYHFLFTITLILSVFLSSSAWAVTYPVSTPVWEIPGGTFQTYFDNMYTTTQCNSIWQVVGWFTATGVPICIIPASAWLGLSWSLGDTLYHDGTTWVASANIYNANGNVGIWTSTPWAKLEVGGQIKITGWSPGNNKVLLSDATGLASWSSVPMPCVPGGSGTNNICYGIGSLTGNTTGSNNAAFGTNTLRNNTTGSDNSAFGYQSLYSLTTAFWNTAVGSNALYSNIIWANNAALWYVALRQNTGDSNTALWSQAFFSNSIGGQGVAVGYAALMANTTGFANTAIGSSAMYQNSIGGYNTSVWQNSLSSNTSGNNNAAIWVNAWSTLLSGNNNIFIGYNTQPNVSNTASNQLNIGNWIYGNNGNIGIGVTNPTAKLEINWQIKIMWGSPGVGKILMSDATGLASWSAFSPNPCTPGGSGIYNTCYGVQSLTSNTTGDYNTANGYNSLFNNTTGSFNAAYAYGSLFNNTTWGYNAWFGFQTLSSNTTWGYNSAVGYRALMQNSSGVGNSALGSEALTSNTTGNYNSAVWHYALFANTIWAYNTANGVYAMNSNTAGERNTANWYWSLYSNTTGGYNTAYGFWSSFANTTGSDNTTLWYMALRNNTTWSNNTALGDNAWYNLTSWNNNIFIGYNTQPNVSNTASNQLNIGNWIYGNNGNIGVGTGANLNNRLVIDSGIDDDSGLRLARLDTNSPLTSNNVIALGVNASGKVLPISPVSNIAVYTWVLRTSSLSPNPDVGTFQVTYDFNKYFDIPGKQSFVVSKGDGPSNNGPYFRENGTSSLCSWNGGYGSSPYDCATNGPDGLSASPWNSFTMTAKGETFGYQIALGARGDAPLFARSGRYNGSVSNGLYTNDSPYQTPAPWQKVLSVPANKPEYLYINTGLNSQLQAISGGWNVGIGTTSPQSRFEVWTGSTTAVLQHFRWTNVGVGLWAVRVLTTGTANAGFGNNTLRALTTWYSNSALGDSSLYGNTTWYFNTAWGSQALYGNVWWNWNTALGTQASWSNIWGSYNVALGWQALYTNTSNNDNVAIGYQSLRLATSDENVAIGSNAGSNLTTGANNIFIGANIQPNVSNTASNQLNIGNWIYGNNGNIGIGVTNPVSKMEVGGTFELWTNGTQLNAIIKSSVTLDVPSIAASACSAQTLSVANATVWASVVVSPASALTDRMIIAYSRVSGAGTVEVKFCNESAAAINLASMQYHITVIQ